MTGPQIICPKCNTSIKLTNFLAAPLIARIRRQLEQQTAEEELELAQRESSLRKTQKALVEARKSIDEDRADGAQDVPVTGRRQGQRVRLHRALLQFETLALDDRIFEPYGVREAGWVGEAIITAIDVLFGAVYRRLFPVANQGLNSRLTF